MNTSFGEAFSLWFNATWKAFVIYIIVYAFYLFVNWRVGFSTMPFVNSMVNMLHALAYVAFFFFQVFFLRKGIEEYYKGDLE